MSARRRIDPLRLLERINSHDTGLPLLPETPVMMPNGIHLDFAFPFLALEVRAAELLFSSAQINHF